jgi:hypothetical protein
MERTNEHLPVEGHAGLRPPAGADLTPSQPLTADAGTIVDTEGVAHRPADKARVNERELLPLTYKDSIQQAASELAGTATPGVVQAPAPVKAAVVAAKPAVVAPVTSKAPDPTQPAASNTDTPSRGLPGTAHSAHRAPNKPALTVEGGFGSGSGEYFALDGTEMKVCLKQLLEEVLGHAENDHRVVGMAALTTAEVTLRAVLTADTDDQTVQMFWGPLPNERGDLVETVTRLCDGAHKDITTDMRLQMSWSYPQYGAALTLTVKAHTGDPGFTLVKHRREFDEAGEPETPPDALREELGLPVPGREIKMAGSLGAISSDVRA